MVMVVVVVDVVVVETMSIDSVPAAKMSQW
jgi:hypothetical protein